MMRNLFRKLHLWLGLASGSIVFILSVTGCLYVFNEEIKSTSRRDAIHLDFCKTETLPLDDLLKDVQSKVGEEKEISFVNIYNRPDKSWVFYSYKRQDRGISYFKNVEYYQSAYVNPYTGDVKAMYNEKYSFFTIVKMLHWSLLLKTEIGQPIVGWSTFLFVIVLLSGIVLWWPKNLKKPKHYFGFNWKKRTPVNRKLYDLHRVLGFYSTFAALIIALTGMVWAFKWFMGIVYVLASGTTVPPDLSRPESQKGLTEVRTSLDEVLTATKRKYPDAASFRIYPAKDSTAAIRVRVRQKEKAYYPSHELYFDQYSAQIIKEKTHKDKNTGEKLISANYDIHVGSILGLPGKIIVFLVSFFCATLPVTGFLLWRNKQTGQKK